MKAIHHAMMIEMTLCKVNRSMFKKHDEIAVSPYEVIISAIEHRVPTEKLDRFKLHYQAICGKTLQELLDENYDVKLLIKELQDVVENN